RSDPPGPVPAPPPLVGGEGNLFVPDLERSRPRAQLGKAGGVEGDSGELPVEVPGLEVALGEPVVDRIHFQAPFVGLQDDPDPTETLEDLDPDGTDGGVHA